jgi:hypothetical protein
MRAIKRWFSTVRKSLRSQFESCFIRMVIRQSSSGLVATFHVGTTRRQVLQV